MSTTKVKINNRFLETYKELETAIREDNPERKVSDHETFIPPERSDKLRLCRYVRNFLQHNPDGSAFIQATPAMCDFLDSEIDFYQVERSTVAEIMTRIKARTTGDSIESVATALKRHIAVPIIDDDKKLIGAIGRDDVIEMILNAGGRLGASIDVALAKKALKKYTVVERTMPASKLLKMDYAILFVTDKKGKYAGVVERK